MTRMVTNSQNDEVFMLDRWRSKPQDIKEALGRPETKEHHLVWRETLETLDESEIEQKKQNDKLWEQNGVDLSVISHLPNLEVLVLEGIHTGHDGHWNYQLDLSPLMGCKKLKNIRITGIRGNSAFKKLDLSPLASCKALEEIKIDTLSLRYIDLSSLSQCDSLWKIQVTYNSILSGIALPSNPTIKEIDLSHNSLITRWMIVGDRNPEVILRPNKHSKMLSLNQLLDLEQLRDSKSLEKLNLSSNKISVVRLSFLKARDRLPIIDLRSNPMRFINVKPIVEQVGQLPQPDVLLIDDDVEIAYTDEFPSSS